MKKVFVVLLTALLGIVAVAPAQAAIPSPLRVVAMGDSYAAGVGAGDYIGGTVSSCWQSLNGTAQQVVHTLIAQGREVTLTNVTCSGDKISDVRAYQLGALKRDTNLVIMTIGGNDVGFGPLVGLCISAVCSGTPIRTAETALPAMGMDLVHLFKEIRSRSPQAQVILVGYGQPMAPGPNKAGAVDPICASQYFDPKERKEGAQFSAALDFTLRAGVRVAQLQGMNVSFVSPYQTSIGQRGTLRSELTGHSLCDMSNQYYRGFDALAPSPAGDPAGQTALLHGNAALYGTLATLVTGALQK